MEGLLLAFTAVIVTFNSEDVIEACLDSLTRTAPEAAALVVDNASTDGTVLRVQNWLRRRRELPSRSLEQEPEHIVPERVQLIVNPHNLGFGGGINRAIASLESDIYLILNPDVQVADPLKSLVAAAQHKGIAAGRLTDENGLSQRGFTLRRFPTPLALILELLGVNRLWASNPVNRRYRYLDRDLLESGPVEQPAGAFLMFRGNVWDELKGFDERFFPVWFEDVDFCKRAAVAGYHTEYVSSVRAVHQGGHSVNRLTGGIRATYWCVSLLRYAQKHFSQLPFRVVAGAMVIGYTPRMIGEVIRDRSLTQVSSYLKIMRFASQCLMRPDRVWRPI